MKNQPAFLRGKVRGPLEPPPLLSPPRYADVLRFLADVQRDYYTTMREHLGNREPVVVELGPEHLSVVAYEDPALPLGTSQAFSLGDAIRALDA